MDTKTARIRALNDELRQHLTGGMAVIAVGVAALGPAAVDRIVKTIAVPNAELAIKGAAPIPRECCAHDIVPTETNHRVASLAATRLVCSQGHQGRSLSHRPELLVRTPLCPVQIRRTLPRKQCVAPPLRLL